MKEGAIKKAAALPAAQRSTSNVQRSTSNGEADGRVFDLEERLLEYAARIIRLVDSLHTTKAANHVGGQLLRSGTSPLPNHGEAQAAESRDDFIHKLKICLKELLESRRWLRLIKRVPLIDKPDKLDPLISETEELFRIFDRSIRTAQSNASVHENAPDLDRWKLEVERWTLNVEPPAGPVNYRKATRKRRAP
ncbi:MAG: four helix bundle protein [Chthoniobacteraceae bacterium]